MILGLNKNSPPTFKSRVATFWRWYEAEADRLFDTIERGECASLAGEIGELMSEALPHLSWVFGPGESGGHSFTVTGEGYVPRQLLAEYWCEHALELPNWSFHASRQPAPESELANFAVSLGEDQDVDVETFQVGTTVDEESELIDLVAWHPNYENIDEEHHLQILFLLLDEALGEFGTQTWVGSISAEPIPADYKTMPLSRLPEFIRQASAYHEWEKLPPLQSYTLYELPTQRDSPRGDTIVGSTVIPEVIFELIDQDGKLNEDPLADTGAEFVYVAIDSDVFPEGRQSDVRGNIEDALDDALGEEDSGRTLGGAFGIEQTYIDLLLVDGERSVGIVDHTLAQLQLGGRYRLHRFV